MAGKHRPKDIEIPEDMITPDQIVFALRALTKSPCQDACPVSLLCHGYIRLIEEGNFEQAFRLIRQRLPFPRVLGRICNAPCEPRCRRTLVDETVAIRDLKRFVSDYAHEQHWEYTPVVKPRRQEKVAIVGSGPAGLAAAYDLAREGFQVTVFEALPVAGGMLVVGCPEFRLPRHVVESEIADVTKLGVEIKLNHEVTSTSALFEQGHKAVFVAGGAPTGRKLPIPGADLPDVMTGLAFLRDVCLKKHVRLGGTAVVLGGGAVAVDCARTALRLGAEVHLACLETREKMPGIRAELAQAEEEGVVLHPARSCSSILGENGKVTGVTLVNVRRARFDRAGKLHLETVADTEHTLPVDTVIFAVGQATDTGFLEANALPLTTQGLVGSDRGTLATGIPGVFAGGDVVTGSGSVVQAIADGQRAALSITAYLNGEEPSPQAKRRDDAFIPFSSIPLPNEQIRRGELQIPRPVLACESRRRSFDEVVLDYLPEQATAEAARCLRCDLVKPAANSYTTMVRTQPLAKQLNDIEKLYQPAPPAFYRKAILHNLGMSDRGKARAENVIFLSCGIFGMLLQAAAAFKLFDILGLDYTFPKREKCCGMVQLEGGVGTTEDMEMVERACAGFANRNLERARELGATRVAHLCQWCAYLQRKFDTRKDMEVVYFPDLLVEGIEKLAERKPRVRPMRVGYFEGCHLRNIAFAPGVEWDWKPYRQLLEIIDGVDIVELPSWKCCHLYKEEIVDEAIAQSLDRLVTPCASCWTHFEPIGRKKGLRVMMIQDLLVEALGEKTFDGLFLS